MSLKIRSFLWPAYALPGLTSTKSISRLFVLKIHFFVSNLNFSYQPTTASEVREFLLTYNLRPEKRGRGKKFFWFDTKNRPLWSFKITSGFDRQCMGGTKIWEHYRLLRIQFFLKGFLDRTLITRWDRYRRFSDYFWLHGRILTRPMTQFNSLAITSKTNQADTLHPLGPNFRTKIGSFTPSRRLFAEIFSNVENNFGSKKSVTL